MRHISLERLLSSVKKITAILFACMMIVSLTACGQNGASEESTEEPAEVVAEPIEEAVAEGDVKRAFDAAHSLKGSLGNLELTPLARPVTEITEKLRHAAEMPDLSDLMSEYEKALADLRALND